MRLVLAFRESPIFQFVLETDRTLANMLPSILVVSNDSGDGRGAILGALYVFLQTQHITEGFELWAPRWTSIVTTANRPHRSRFGCLCEDFS